MFTTFSRSLVLPSLIQGKVPFEEGQIREKYWNILARDGLHLQHHQKQPITSDVDIDSEIEEMTMHLEGLIPIAADMDGRDASNVLFDSCHVRETANSAHIPIIVISNQRN